MIMRPPCAVDEDRLPLDSMDALPLKYLLLRAKCDKKKILQALWNQSLPEQEEPVEDDDVEVPCNLHNCAILVGQFSSRYAGGGT